MTSCYETFGLVLLEAMNYGVVPIAFNSYPNLKDIIENDKDGCIIAPFNINEYADKLLMMMKNERELTRLRENAKMKIGKYNIGLIGCKWIELFSYLKIINENPFLTPYLPSNRAGGENFTRLLLEQLSISCQIDLVYYKYYLDPYYVAPNDNVRILKVCPNSTIIKLKIVGAIHLSIRYFLSGLIESCWSF